MDIIVGVFRFFIVNLGVWGGGCVECEYFTNKAKNSIGNDILVLQTIKEVENRAL